MLLGNVKGYNKLLVITEQYEMDLYKWDFW